MAEFVESIRYEADISDLREKLRRIDSDHDDVSRKTDTHTGKMAAAWGKVTHGIGGVLASVAKVGLAVGAVGVAAGVAFGKKAVDAASNLDESMSKVNVVFGDAAKGVVAWSKDSAQAFGQSQQSALEAAGTYGNLFQAFGLGQKPAQDMSQSLVELAADLASFNNTSVEEALQALQSGVSGETEPLKRYGVAINDVRLKEQALAMGLIASTKDALTPAAKAQASYALIMQDTTLAQGDFARTSDGLANKQRILAAQFENAKAKIGAVLIPAMLGAVSVISGKVLPAFEKLWEFFIGGLTGEFTNEGSGIFLFVNKLGMRIGELVDWVKANWSTISKVIGVVMQAAGKVIGWVADKVLTGLRVAVGAVVDWVSANWPTIKAVFTDVIKGIVSIWNNQLRPTIDAIVAAFKFASENIEYVIPIIAAVGYAVASQMIPKLVAWIATNYALAASWIAANAPIIAVAAAIAALVAGVIYAYQHWDWFRQTVDAVATWLRDVLWPVLQNVFSWMQANIPPILQGIADVAMTVFGWLRDNVPPIIQGIAAVFTAGFEIVRTVVQTVTDAIRVIWDTFGSYIMSYIQAVWDTVSAIVQGALDVIRGIIQTVTALIHGDWSGAWDGIKQIVSGVLDAISGVIQGAVDGYKAILGAAWTAIGEAASLGWNALKDGIATVWTNITDGISASIDTIIEFVTGIPGRVADAIGDGFSAIWENFKEIVGKIPKALNGLKFTFSLPEIDTHIPGIGKIGGQSMTIDPIPLHVPEFHGGGTVPGHSGQEVLSVLLAGETVRTSRQERMLQQALASRPRSADPSVTIQHYGQTVTPATISAGLAMARLSR